MIISKQTFVISVLVLPGLISIFAFKPQGRAEEVMPKIKHIANTTPSRDKALNSRYGTLPKYTDEQLVRAIFLAEGGRKAKFAYGIRSVRYSSIAKARQACLETIQNNRVRWERAGRPGDYLEFLASRYAPENADNDPRGLNKFWLKNVKYFLDKL